MTKEVSCQDDKVNRTSKCCDFDCFLRCALLGMAQVGQLKVIITQGCDISLKPGGLGGMQRTLIWGC
jgi:hypothetical protein